MTTRRSFVGAMAGFAGGALGLVDRVRATGTRRRDRSRGRRTVRSGTTIAGTATRSAVRAARVPDGLGPHVNAIEERVPAVGLDQCDGITGTATVSAGRLLAATAVATGSIETDAVRREYRTRRGVTGETRNGTERFVTDDGLAIAPIDGSLVVSYAADGAEAALARLDATLDTRAGRPASIARQGGTALESVLGGDAVVTADLGDGTRRRLRNRLDGAVGPLPTVVGAADELGMAVEIQSTGRTNVTYGIVADPARLSIDTVRSVIREAETGPETVRDVRLRHSDRIILVDAAVALDDAVAAHAEAIGLDRQG
ncbi:hypothetical protein ACFO5R_13925 [Halosolutus amylolyticus]|uniref:Uncharacterized protein n=1 Tax=Halosolutus amylolyticus TaxID=2932267 RepID=A0ABD5PRC0_9EURY|nr:hypothetical protein [Halosolutus amylolyticus]